MIHHTPGGRQLRTPNNLPYPFWKILRGGDLPGEGAVKIYHYSNHLPHLKTTPTLRGEVVRGSVHGKWARLDHIFFLMVGWVLKPSRNKRRRCLLLWYWFSSGTFIGQWVSLYFIIFIACQREAMKIQRVIIMDAKNVRRRNLFSKISAEGERGVGALFVERDLYTPII